MICRMRRLCTIQKGEAQCCSSHQSLLYLPYPITATSSSLHMINEKLNERSRQLLDEIKRRTQTTAYVLAFDSESTPTIFDSKVGGLPYWDPAKTYPTDSNGKKMFLLAQINFDQDKAESPLPQSGMLQFFIGGEEMYGLDLDHPTEQKDWRIVYHEKVDASVTAETVEAMGIPSNNGDDEEVDSPVFRSCVFRLVKKETWLTPDNWERFDELTLEVAEDLFGETEAESANEVFGEDQYALLEEEYFYSENSQLLGHPFFTQEDVREEGSRYNTLLFQLDSETVDDVVMWGDSGVGNFFINAEDLKRLDFSNVLYNWDCC